VNGIRPAAAPVQAVLKPIRPARSCLILAGLAAVLVCAAAVAVYAFREPLGSFAVEQALAWGLGSMVEGNGQPVRTPTPARTTAPTNLPAATPTKVRQVLNPTHPVAPPALWQAVDIDEVGVRLYVDPETEVTLSPEIDYGKLILFSGSILVEGQLLDFPAGLHIDMVWEPGTAGKPLLEVTQEWLDFQSGYLWEAPEMEGSGAGSYAWSIGRGVEVDLAGWTAVYYPLESSQALMLLCTFHYEDVEDTLIYLEKVATSAQLIPR